MTSDGGALCGSVPTSLAGTTDYWSHYYWSHLWAYHRSVWYELKRREGALNPAGEAELARLKEGLSNMATDTQVRYIRYRDNIGDNQYGESYNIGNKQYSSKHLLYCPIYRFSG